MILNIKIFELQDIKMRVISATECHQQVTKEKWKATAKIRTKKLYLTICVFVLDPIFTVNIIKHHTQSVIMYVRDCIEL
jgi:arginase family enzyme